VQSRIDANGLREKVTLLGSIGVEQVQAELAQTSVFALVSLEENAPLGIEEAMAVGVPVVASNRCGMPYMVRHGETGFLVNPFAPNDIAQRIRQLLSDQNLRRAMGERSRQVAFDDYHPELVAKRTMKVYSEAIQGY
jgi:glycosyltransferase involved in cell wall biosynthesis